MKSKEEIEKSMDRLKEIQSRKHRTYEKAKLCPRCGTSMKYVYGELFECPQCGLKERSDFGKVRDFLDTNGPQPAIVIADATGVEINIINEFLKEGRVEIPDGSSIYIQCQGCGADIRYGRFCPDCMQKMTKNLGTALWMPDVGEKPRHKTDMTGKMHTLDDNDQLHPNSKRRVNLSSKGKQQK